MGLLNWLGMDSGCENDPVALSDRNFRDEVRKSEVPVVVDVWSDGCPPCVALAPTIKRLACKYDGKVKVCELNVELGPKAARKLGVYGTPTVLFFDEGKVVNRVVGMRAQEEYEDIIEGELLAQVQ